MPSFLKATVFLSLCGATQAHSESITCFFPEKHDRWAVYTTLLGMPGQQPDWIAQSISVQSTLTQVIDGLWVGVAKETKDYRVAEITVRHFHYGGVEASGVALVAAPLTSAAFQAWLDTMLGEGKAETAPQTVWGILTLDGAQRMSGPMVPKDFGVGAFNEFQLGYHNETDSGMQYGPQPEAVEAIRALSTAAITASMEVYDVNPSPDTPPSPPPANARPLARFTFDPAEVAGKLRWANRAMQDYLASFAAGCPDNRQ